VVHRGLLREGVYGWCTVEDCDSRPRSFLIDINGGINNGVLNFDFNYSHNLFKKSKYYKYFLFLMPPTLF